MSETRKRLTPAMKRKLVPWIDKLLRAERKRLRTRGVVDCPLCTEAVARQRKGGYREEAYCNLCPVFGAAARRPKPSFIPCEDYTPGGAEGMTDHPRVVAYLKRLKKQHEEEL